MSRRRVPSIDRATRARPPSQRQRIVIAEARDGGGLTWGTVGGGWWVCDSDSGFPADRVEACIRHGWLIKNAAGDHVEPTPAGLRVVQGYSARGEVQP